MNSGRYPLQYPGVPLRNEAGPRYVPRDDTRTPSRQAVFVVEGLRSSAKVSEKVTKISGIPSVIVESDPEVYETEGIWQSGASWSYPTALPCSASGSTLLSLSCRLPTLDLLSCFVPTLPAGRLTAAQETPPSATNGAGVAMMFA